ncbi:hypothetical protein CALCODRAFT_516116 [Calocera cornea HHB12733]|uniref:F-box domain-containing protein n=1 Tax=Calocera cornea HHB12733 TaxID=1353952 RepID=A0A165HIC0_9BASI|nr:hypothetical protein CALCODRAFT_516116 [Calocera cornea HHB12733]
MAELEPVMHQFWGIDELVALVLGYLERHDLARVARTSKRLFLLSTPLVWARPSFKGLAGLTVEPSAYRPARLFAQLGRLVWGDTETKANWLGSNASSFERLLYYGAYVRRLDIIEATNGRAEDFLTVVSIIHQSDSDLTDVFPSLVYLYITAATPDFVAQTVRFASPKLQYLSLSLIVLGLTDDEPGSRYSDFLPWVLDLPRLDNLQMYGRTTSASAEADFLEQTATQFPGLKMLDAPLMLVDASFLGPLARMKGLQDLNMQLDSLPSVPPIRCDLPMLKQLNVVYTRVHDLQCLLEAISAPALTVLQIKSNAIRITGTAAAGNTRAYRNLCTIIARSWPGLQVFTLSGFPGIITLQTSPTPWVWDTFSPLMQCHDMRTFTVQTPVKVDVSDRDLCDMANTWPHLTDLALAIPEGSIVEQPKAGINGLIYLAQKCRQLENIGLSINLECPADEAPLSLLPNAAVLRVDVHDCPPVNAIRTADILKQLFPSLIRFWFCTRKMVRNNAELDEADERRMECMKEIKARLGLGNR